jgi:hypothetical protein
VPALAFVPPLPPPVEVIEPKTELEPDVSDAPPAPTVTVYEVPAVKDCVLVKYPPAPPPPPLDVPETDAPPPPPPATTKYSVLKEVVVVACEANDKVPVALKV